MIIHKCKTPTTIILLRFSLVLQRLMVQEFPLLISQLMRRLIKILLPTLSKNMKQLLMLFKTIPTLGLNLQHAWSDLLVMISWTSQALSVDPMDVLICMTQTTWACISACTRGSLVCRCTVLMRSIALRCPWPISW